MVAERRPTLPDGLTYLGLLGAALTSYKLMPYFVVASLFGTGSRLSPAACQLATLLPGTLSALASAVSRRLSSWTLKRWWAPAMLAIALAFGLSRPVLFPPWVPMRAADYLESHRTPGHVYASAKSGSYLIFRFHGALPVFIDTRFDMYGERLAQLYFAVNRQALFWRQVFDRYGIDCALVDAGSGIARALSQASDWKEVYRDPGWLIFVRSAARAQGAPESGMVPGGQARP